MSSVYRRDRDPLVKVAAHSSFTQQHPSALVSTPSFRRYSGDNLGAAPPRSAWMRSWPVAQSARDLVRELHLLKRARKSKDIRPQVAQGSDCGRGLHRDAVSSARGCGVLWEMPSSENRRYGREGTETKEYKGEDKIDKIHESLEGRTGD